METKKGLVFCASLLFLLAVACIGILIDQNQKVNKIVTNPLTLSLNETNVWVVKSHFVPVSEMQSLYVAEAQPKNTNNRVKQMVFLDVRGCVLAQIRIPRVGEEVKVKPVGFRMTGITSAIRENHLFIMNVVKPDCS